MYPQRRKRNLGLPTDVQKSPDLSYGIDDDDWENEDTLEEGLEEVELDEGDELDVDDDMDDDEIEEGLENGSDESETQEFLLNGKPFVPKQTSKKLSFEETHVRITTYLEKDCQLIVRMLLKQGQIPSITSFINESVKAYLLNEFSTGQ